MQESWNFIKRFSNSTEMLEIFSYMRLLILESILWIIIASLVKMINAGHLVH